MKKATAFITAIVLLLASCYPAFANSEEQKAFLYSFYDNNMLFQANEPAVLAGKAATGCQIKAQLIDGETILCEKTVTAGNGLFEVSLDAQAGGYKEYTIKLFENGTEFKTLCGVVFGYLWLASGQSNMELALNYSSKWQNMEHSGEFGSEWTRFLCTPHSPIADKEQIPAVPVDEIKDCIWVKGSSELSGSVSAVAFYFAQELEKNLNMPVGVLVVSLGGSTINSWLSRESIENSDSAMAILKRSNSYVPLKNYKGDNTKMHILMCANYNMRLYPLRRFNIAGMIWYQGESELLLNSQYGDYTVLFDLLQKDITKTFGYENGPVPVVYSMLASYKYETETRHLQLFNAELAEIQNLSPDTRAVAAIYDVPLDYVEAVQPIHPIVKEPVGRRLAKCAEGLVYNKGNACSSAYIKDVRIKDDAVLVCFNNVGDGLTSSVNTLYDFALCSQDGVYYKADAEIISPDTVRITCPYVSNPKSATYAVSQVNLNANLYSSKDGEKFLPVAPFITDRNYSGNLYYELPWTECESEKYWRQPEYDNLTGFYDLWLTENCNYKVLKTSAFKGEAGLNVSAPAGCFSLSQVYSFKNEGKSVCFLETSPDFSRFGTLSVNIRNNGSKDLVISGLDIKTNGVLFLAPTVNGTADIGIQIPADGQWHKVEFNLNRAYAFGNSKGLVLNGKKHLKNIKSFALRFSSGDDSVFDIDEFNFAPETENQKSIKGVYLIKVFVTVFDYIKNAVKSCC
ncbi:MAG: hypothetical protein K6B52_07555 [Clostridiales bacterium]|nr:hypothetical protein [Clostridiales bacterium]